MKTFFCKISRYVPGATFRISKPRTVRSARGRKYDVVCTVSAVDVCALLLSQRRRVVVSASVLAVRKHFSSPTKYTLSGRVIFIVRFPTTTLLLL